jgi:hypothetical protein
MMEDTYGHTPIKKAFDLGDVYGVGFDEARASRKKLKIGFIGAGPVVQSKHWPAIKRLQMIWEPVEVTAFALRTEAQAHKVEQVLGGRWYKDYREMLQNEPLDGVIVSSSDPVHAEHSIACIERGGKTNHAFADGRCQTVYTGGREGRSGDDGFQQALFPPVPPREEICHRGAGR